MIDMNKIEHNWDTFSKLLSRLCDQGINDLLKKVEQRLCVAPANPRIGFYGAHPGGLINSSLKITNRMRVLNETYGRPCTIRSIILVGLLHDLGRFGDSEEDQYIDQDSDWHREKLGKLYKENEKIFRIPYFQRSLLLLQEFGIKLTREEYTAIATCDRDLQRGFDHKLPWLAILLHHARDIEILKEAEGKSDSAA